jgi:hypothetical protein
LRHIGCVLRRDSLFRWLDYLPRLLSREITIRLVHGARRDTQVAPTGAGFGVQTQEHIFPLTIRKDPKGCRVGRVAERLEPWSCIPLRYLGNVTGQKLAYDLVATGRHRFERCRRQSRLTRIQTPDQGAQQAKGRCNHDPRSPITTSGFWCVRRHRLWLT